MNNLAMTYSALGRHADALAMAEQALEFRRRVLPADHPDIGEGCEGRDGLGGMGLCCDCDWDASFSGMALYNLSVSYETSGSLPRALKCAREALRIWQTSLPPGHQDVADAQSQVHDLERALK
jgi:tetratricopeptide (TPR) repeat protein